MSSTGSIKQIAAGRRKPNMTRKEYFDHHFRIHGAISDGVEDKSQKPHKYIQTQVFDAVFGSRVGGPLNANQHWCGRDDTTELYFHNWDHISSCFNSAYVKGKVGPDGPFFADFETSMVLLAYEKKVKTHTRLALERSQISLDKGDATVAMYFLSTIDNERNGEDIEATVSPLLTTALEEHCQDDVWGVIANVGAVSEKFDLNAYFGGANMPQYALVYKVFLKDSASVSAFRKSQKVFENAAPKNLDLNESFVIFSHEALVMDMDKDIRFSIDAQPIFHDLPGPSHLD